MLMQVVITILRKVVIVIVVILDCLLSSVLNRFTKLYAQFTNLPIVMIASIV